MHDLQLRRLKFSKEADTWLKVMKSRTGITPNLLCRVGFCLSLEEPGVVDVVVVPDGDQVALRERDADIDRPVGAEVGGVPEVAETIVAILLDELGHTVGRRVVDNHDLEVRVRLPKDRLETLPQVTRLVGRQDDRDERRAAHLAVQRRRPLLRLRSTVDHARSSRPPLPHRDVALIIVRSGTGRHPAARRQHL